MRLITYQNAPDEFWNGGFDGDTVQAMAHYERKTYGLSYKPIWCLPAEDVETSLIANLLCAPNEPYIALIIESEDYQRVDKVEWYRRIRDGVEELPITSSADDLHSEFVIPSNLLDGGFASECFKSMYILPPMSTSLDSLLAFSSEHAMSSAWRELWNHEDFRGLFSSTADRVVAELSRSSLWSDEVPSDRLGMRMRSECVRRAFIMTMLPYILQLAQCEPGDRVSLTSAWCDSMTHTINSLMTLCNRLTIWSERDCSDSGFDEIIDLMRLCLVSDDEILNSLVAGVGRNETCPCGSGKKFKKCHGLVWNS